MDYFSPSYFNSREKFCSAIQAANFTHQIHPIQAKGPHSEQLTIDIGIRRAESSERALFITSGTHGVEGYFGAAVQRAFLSNPILLEMASHYTIVLVHAVNPYGFAWDRRFNENNIDLNRSFFSPGEDRPETLKDFHQFENWLAPPTPPPSLDLDPFLTEFMELVKQYGLAYLKQVLPVGQYDYPRCLFYGGNSPSETQIILATHLAEWAGDAQDITLIDFHTGLGEWGSYKLLASKNADMDEIDRLRNMFGKDNIEEAKVYDMGEGVSYNARGTLPAWFKAQFPGRKCYTATAEFGTYNEMRVLQSLVAENRAHFYGDKNGEHAWTRNDLIEMFTPADPDWRAKVIANAEVILKQALL
ncbi:MAG: M14 family metallopeptidase [Pseudomonadota bacterium]